ncbi:MAG TPA: NAD-glutamate dehydrogenase [Gaiellales bacterium]|nr:NAD-glutamate dehydrogenase [Gaiellales bacterium]
MSSEPQAPPAVAEPDSSDAALVDTLLEELGASRVGILAEFVRAYVRRVPAVLVAELGTSGLAAHVAHVYSFMTSRQPGELAVRAYNPELGSDGWESIGSVVEVAVEDAPFLVDTVTTEMHVHGLQVRAVVHPVVGVERSDDGRIEAITPARGAARRESVMHFQADRRLEADGLERLRADLVTVLSDLRMAVRDFLPMVERVETMIEAAQEGGSRFSPAVIQESTEFLQWLTDDSFIYLGYREYAISGAGDDAVITVVPGSGLGVMSDDSQSRFARPVAVSELEQSVRDRVFSGPLLTVAKTNRETAIHRRARMDYIGVKRFDGSGAVVGELRMIGLFTSKAYAESARQIPLIRRKLEAIMRWEDLIVGSHDYKAVVELFDSFPKDELFAVPAQELRTTIMALAAMQEERNVRVFLRVDPMRRTVWAVVALPRDRVSTALRVRLEHLFEYRYQGVVADYALSFATDPARFHFTIHVGEGGIPDVSPVDIQREVAAAARSWDDALSDALAGAVGEMHGHELARRYAALFPDYYKSASGIEAARLDVQQFERIGDDRPYVVALQNETGATEPLLTRVKLYKTGGKAPLTELLPLLEQLGLTVVEEVPTRLQGDTAETRYLHDFGVLGPDGRQLDLDVYADLVSATVGAVWDGRAGSDWLNRLVVAGRLSWQQITILRAYREYRQVLGATFTSRYQNDCFVRNSGIARKLVQLFEIRFDPNLERAEGGADGEDPEAALVAEISADLDAVTSLDDDRILRGYLGMIQATVRTNAYVREGGHLSFKLRCADVPNMPRPVPLWEIFVYSPAMAGVHLRGGMVARGGIRWSDRLEDYRTEILGLMKAQMVKNAVIVPVGAKGGFVLKQPPADRAELRDEERRQYITLMRGMLDLTDNMVGGEVVHPPNVRVLDGPDPYLVVAADKGTAHLSDTANGVSAEYGFWLGDAYASGGSDGYDHKALGITARGGWESVTRHFRELGRDVMTEPFTAVGIGDMSGDVFGNGMLLSRQMRLLAAFDHRHIFIDPDPDPEATFEERTRLFGLPASSWDDYNRELISAGGGIWPRSAKSVPLSPQAREALGIDAERLTPTEVIQAILRAPVDLLWNGGIGTYVKASTESHADVGDRTNDAVRIDGRQLRAKVVGEGGNLGLTQRGRIEYALGGGRINTDAIDNSAGVDCSDHEVNLKILLGLAIEAGELTLEERNEVLQSVVNDVVAHVLYDNYLQVQILSQETAVAAQRMEAYEDLMAELETRGLLERALEFLPTPDQMAERRAGGNGLVRPELAVLLAYAKRLLREQVLASSLPDDPYLDASLAEYFPPTVVERFGHLMGAHPLRREIVATIVTNDVINSMGITFVSRMVAETGAGPEEVAAAFIVARDVSNSRDPWDAVEKLDRVVPNDLQADLMDGVDTVVAQLARWYLTHVPQIDLQAEVERSRGPFADLVACMGDVATTAWRLTRDERLERLLEQGVPREAARFAAIAPDLVYAPDIITVAQTYARPIADVAHAFFVIGERLYLDVIERRASELPADTRWQRLAWSSLADDLRLLRRQIASAVLAETGDASIDDAVDRYLAARTDPYGRLASLMTTLAAAPGDDASVIMVAVHQIRQVIA